MDALIVENHMQVGSGVPGAKRYSKTAEDREMNKMSQLMCIDAGDNSLYELFYYANCRKIGRGLHGSCWPDILHVVLKGIVEKNLSWTLAIVYGFHRIGGEQWQDSMAVLDARVENFAVVPNFEGIRLYSFPDCLMIRVDQPTLHVIPGGSAFARVSPVF
jgi:hypothetical protein